MAGRRSTKGASAGAASAPARDPLVVQSVEKVFRVLEAFEGDNAVMSLSEVAVATGLDVSAAQRFTHTLTRLGYLAKDDKTRRFKLTSKAMRLGYNFLSSERIVATAMPYLMHISKETEETVNLTMLEGTNVLFLARLVSRNVLSTDVIVGSRMPAYCSAPGIAMLSRLPEEEAVDILDRSEIVAHTPYTTVDREALIDKIRLSAQQGYATSFEELYRGDASIAAAILDEKRRPEGAINIAVSYSRYRPDQIVPKFATMLLDAARAISRT